MGHRPPPPPISRKEFEERWNAGARTLEELDPALAQWARQGQTMRLVGSVAMAVATVLLLFLIALIGGVL